MATSDIQRDIGKDGSVVLKDARVSFTFRSSPGVLEIRIEGIDKGQLGTRPWTRSR